MMGLWLGMMLLASPDGGVEEPKLTAVTPMVKAQELMGEAGLELRSDLPASWREPSALGLERWQWFGLPVLGALIVLLTVLLVRLTVFVIRRVWKEPAAAEKIVSGLLGPTRVWWGSLLARLSLPVLGLTETSEALWQTAFRLGVVIGFFWGAVRAVAAWRDNFANSAFARVRPGSKALVSLLSRVGRIALMVFGLLAALNELGYSVTSVLAGLGIGGIALALGAQKTLENVFGAFALAVDQPIREGDFVRVEDFVGTVESIGLRSTRIRTLDRTVISIPNGKLADMRLETFAARDRIRLHAFVGLSRASTPEQINEVLEGFREVVRARKEIWPDSISVHLVKLAESSLEIEVSVWFVVADFDQFKRVREEVLLSFLGVVERSGTSLAFPTQTLRFVGGANEARSRPAQPAK